MVTKQKAKYQCPSHGKKMRRSQEYQPPEGYDPKMTRWLCPDDVEHWYIAPRHCAMKAEEIQATFGALVAP